MLFVKYPDLLKRLVAELLTIPHESIGEFVITNPDMPPDIIGEKFCRLDINMTVNGQRVDLEIQVNNEGDYPERSLYYWAREFSTALGEGEQYIDLPRTIVISIVAFEQFDCEDFHSEFQALEVKRHTLLTDRMSLHFFELPKVSENVDANEKLKLWLKLFNAKTEEDLAKIEAMEVPEMKQAIGAYRTVTATDEFKELERLRSRARHNEASAIGKARREAIRETDEKWEGVIADKDAELASKDAELEGKDAEIAALKALLSAK
jgi:predicted transposase/invertase (TIGR01784 family)